MYTEALFTRVKYCMQSKCPVLKGKAEQIKMSLLKIVFIRIYNDEWIKKMWYLYTMEFYAARKKNEMLSFAGKWMELENIILSEVSLAQKTKNRMFSLICGH
jgi:hypothetical protein